MTENTMRLFVDLDAPAGLSRSTDPGTSAQAARTITGRTEQKILRKFREYAWDGYGFTDDELAAAVPDIFPPTLKSARSRLSNKGLLVDSGERRASQRGQQMIVWKLSTERAVS